MQLVTEQSIEAIICIRQGRKPERIKGKITCEDKKLTLNLSSYGKHNDSIMIPYPMPDTWYIAVQAKCSSNGYLFYYKYFHLFSTNTFPLQRYYIFYYFFKILIGIFYNNKYNSELL